MLSCVWNSCAQGPGLQAVEVGVATIGSDMVSLKGQEPRTGPGAGQGMGWAEL